MNIYIIIAIYFLCIASGIYIGSNHKKGKHKVIFKDGSTAYIDYKLFKTLQEKATEQGHKNFVVWNHDQGKIKQMIDLDEVQYIE